MKTSALGLTLAAVCLMVENSSASPPNVRVWRHSGAAESVPDDVTNAVAVAVGANHVLALRADGTVAAWGCDYAGGACDVPPGLSNVISIEASDYYSAALKQDGTVVFWGILGIMFEPPPWFLTSLTNVAELSGNSGSLLLLRRSGEVWWQGMGGYFDDTPADLTNVSHITVTERAINGEGPYAAAITSSGNVVIWGDIVGRLDLSLSPPADLTNAIAVSGGDFHILALRSDHTVAAWGAWEKSANYDRWNMGQAEVPPGLTDVVAIKAYGSSSFALRANGTLVAWGTNTYVPPDLPFVTAFNAGASLRAAIVQPNTATAPVILMHPTRKNVTAELNGEAVFRTSAAGFPPLNYQWYFGSTPIPGATNTTLHLHNLTSADSGTYKASVSNSGGMTWTEEARLTVLPGLRIDLVPAVTLIGTVGQQYQLEWLDPLGSPADWSPLATVLLTNSPQYYFDTSAIGRPARLYRSTQVP